MADWVNEGFSILQSVQRWSSVPSNFVASVHQILLKFIVPLSITCAWKRYNLEADLQESKEDSFLLIVED